MEAEMIPVYIASALVSAHGRAAADVAAIEAEGCLQRGDLANMRLWQAAGAVADLVLNSRHALAPDGRPLR
jgi:hypothetical protein